MSRKRNSETWWTHTTTTFLGVLFGTYKRHDRDALVGRRGYVPLRDLGNVPLRRRWMIHLRRFRPRYDVPIRGRRDAPRRGLGHVPSRRRWVFHLRRTCDIAGMYRETSLRCRHDVLMPGGTSAHKVRIK